MHDHLQLYTQGTSDLSEGESSDPLFRNYSESTRFSLDAEDTVHIKHDKVADSVKSVLAASKAQKKSSESTLRTAEHLAIDYPGKVVHSIETFSTALRDQKKDLKGALIGSGGPPSFRNTMVSTAPVSSPKEIEEPSELREDEKFRVQKGQKENTENDESKANADKENSVNLLEAGGQEYIDLKDDKVEFEDDNGCDENEAIPDSDQLDKMNMPDSSGDESNDPLLRNHSESRRHSLDAEYSTPDSQDNVSDSAKTFLAVSKIQEKRNTFVVSTHSESPPKESLELLNSSDTEKEDNAEEVNPKESDDHKKAKNEDIIKVMEEMLFGTRHQKDTGLNTNKILETFSKMCEERQQEEVNDVLNSSFHSTDHDEEVPMDIDDSETSSADEDEVVSAAQSILLKTKKLEMPKKAKEPEHVLPDTSEIVSKSTNKREPVVNNPKVQHRFDPRLRRKASLDTPPVQPVVTPVRKQSAFASVLSAVSGASIHQLLPVATPSRPVQESVPSVGLSVSVNQRAHIYKQLSMSSVSVVHEMPKSILKTSTDIPEPSKTVLTFPAPRSTFSGHPSRPNLIQISMEPQVKLHKTAAGHKESFSENHFPTPVSSSALGQVHFPPLHEPATSPKKSAVRPIGKQDSDMFLFPPKQGSSEVEELNQNTTGTSVNLSSPPAVDPYRPELLKSCQRRIQHKSDHSPLRSPPPMKTAQVPASSVSRVISPLKLNSFMAPAAISPKKICPVKIVPKLRLRKDSKSIYRVSSDQLLTSTAVTSPKPQKAKTSNGALEPRSELKPLTSPDMVVLKLKEPFVIPRKNNSSLKLNPPKSVPELMAEDRKQAKSISKKPCKDLICPDLNSMSTVLTPLKPKPALESMSKPKLVLGPLTQDKDLYIPKKPSKEEQQNLKNSIFSDLDSLVIDTAQMRSPAALKLTTKEPATVMESPQPLQLVLPPISRAIGVKVSASKNPFLAEVSSNDNLFLRKCAPKKRTSEEDGSKAAEFLRRVQESRLSKLSL
ncbi:hypothetical protein L596_028769 [Steinernema carpocapsae]|uniref:Uncharacterized protein n=1 Tax=Steinernema carpocapsae TaxID=34508 RepID=A0A4U5LZC6_STECR|nr:hypothetical protein L596_028769 [Steinernema carpocapsae]